MIRTFQSVGQGAFYTEEFSGFNVIYDCGTDTGGIKSINKEISTVFNKNESIDIVFVSHFHRDHINGLQHLLSHCKVKFIVLPLLCDYQRIEVFFETYKLNSQFINDLILDPENAINQISSGTKVIFVKPFDGILKDPMIEYIESTSSQVLESGVRIRSKNIDKWEYIPFNFIDTNRRQLLKEKLESSSINIGSVDHFKRAWQNSTKKKNLIKAYKSITPNLNLSTMTIYSGPLEDDCYRGRTCSDRPLVELLYPFVEPVNVGCLYLGDYEAKDKSKWDSLEQAYKGIWDKIGTIQIPHHGSKENYNELLNSNPYIYSVISAGIDNKHRHPHSYTTAKIIENKGILRQVTESPSSRLHFIIEKI